MQSINNTVAVREISNTAAALMKLLLGIEGTCGNRSVVAASAGSRTRVQQALDASYHQPRPWSGLGVTLVNLPKRVWVMRSRRDA